MLDAHPRISMTYQSGFLPSYASRQHTIDLNSLENVKAFLQDFYSKPSIQRWKATNLPDAETVYRRMKEATVGALFDALYTTLAEQRGRVRWGDKSNDFASYMDSLTKLFPRAQFIHIVRDCRDVVLSRLGIRWFSHDIVKIAHEWLDTLEVAEQTSRRLGPGCYLQVYYEALIQQPEVELRRICEFLREDFFGEMLEYPSRSRDRIPEGDMHVHQNTTKGPIATHHGLWKTKMRPSDQMIIESIAGARLAACGYPLLGVRGQAWKAKVLYYRLRGMADRLLNRRL
jgi:hypothetical protein